MSFLEKSFSHSLFHPLAGPIRTLSYNQINFSFLGGKNDLHRSQLAAYAQKSSEGFSTVAKAKVDPTKSTVDP